MSEVCRIVVFWSIIPRNLVGGYFALKEEAEPSSKTLLTACWTMGCPYGFYKMWAVP
jgi:hypothetical protein